MDQSLEHLKPVIRCPSCQKKYDPKSVALLFEDDRRTMLHLTCVSCQAKSIVRISIGKMGVVSFGSLTDLDADEAVRFWNMDPVTVDETLDMHLFLSRTKGSLTKIMKATRT